MQEEKKDFMATLEQEVKTHRKHLQQAILIAEELAELLELIKKARQDLDHQLQSLQDLRAQGNKDFERIRQEWQGLRQQLENWSHKLEKHIQEHLKESQNRLSEIQHLTFKRLDRVEDLLSKHRDELEEGMKSLGAQMNQVGQQLEKVQQMAIARYMEVKRAALTLRKHVFALWMVLGVGLLAFGAYVWGR
jgi:DNA repair exonuclease SbcCD ATPase subunit